LHKYGALLLGVRLSFLYLILPLILLLFSCYFSLFGGYSKPQGHLLDTTINLNWHQGLGSKGAQRVLFLLSFPFFYFLHLDSFGHIASHRIAVNQGLFSSWSNKMGQEKGRTTALASLGLVFDWV
jgi:hypothetical protein